MRFLLVLIISVFLFLGLSATQALATPDANESVAINGFVRVQKDEYSFIDSETHKVYELRAYTFSAQNTLNQLKDLDGIAGTGFYVGDTLLIESIEFVGLRRLIGFWQTSKTVVNFLDFTRVQFRIPSMTSLFKYAISPSQDGVWRVFFSDAQSLALGTLTIDNTSAFLEIYDPETGETVQRLDLKKVTK